MAKYAAGEATVRATDQAVQSLGGNGMTVEYGVASLVAAARATRIAPVSREMILNFVAQHSLGPTEVVLIRSESSSKPREVKGPARGHPQ